MKNTCLSIFFFFYLVILHFCSVQNYKPDHKEVLNIVPTPFDKNSIGYASKRLNETPSQSEVIAHTLDSQNKSGTVLNDSQKSTPNQDISPAEKFSLNENKLQQQSALNGHPNTAVQQSGVRESESEKEENITQNYPGKERKEMLSNQIRTVPSPWKDDGSDMNYSNAETDVLVSDDEWEKVFQLLSSGYEPPQNIWLKFRKHIDN